MTKSEAIKVVNNYQGADVLNSSNTNFSKINASKNVWWLNIPPQRFSDDLNLLLLKNDDGFIWVKIPGQIFPNLERKFKIRQDKNVVDLEISSDSKYMFMRDIKSGGTGFNFETYIEKIFSHN